LNCNAVPPTGQPAFFDKGVIAERVAVVRKFSARRVAARMSPFPSR
jgi:hypothetical protein